MDLVKYMIKLCDPVKEFFVLVFFFVTFSQYAMEVERNLICVGIVLFKISLPMFYWLCLQNALLLNIHHLSCRQQKMADAEDIQPLVCDNGTGMVKVHDGSFVFVLFVE